MNEADLRFLRLLRTSQSDGLRRSKIPKRSAGLVELLQTCGAVEFRPSKQGRGIVLAVTSEEALRRFIDARLPHGPDIDCANVTDRASAVVYFADAKVARKSVEQGIFIRSTHRSTVIRSIDRDTELPVGTLTCEAGGAAIRLSSSDAWTFSGVIAVVENADAFWRYEVVLPDVDLAIWGNGNLSDRLVSWLASQEMSSCRIVHWGDYDPVGVCQFARLAAACPNRVEAFAPAEIDNLLPIYGKRSLITRQTKYLERLREKMSDPHVFRMVRLFDLHRRGLEQELQLRLMADTSRGDCSVLFPT